MSASPAAPALPDPIEAPLQTAPALTLGTWVRLTYWAVAAVLLLRAAIGWLRVRRIARRASPLPSLGTDTFESSDVRQPATCGLWRGRILLPANWRQWTPQMLDSVLAHERSHIVERDFLTQSLAKVYRALYWFHPLAWWLDRHLADLAEQVSDDAALSTGAAEATSYADILLSLASGGAHAVAVAMARPENVGWRIERILDQSRRISNPLGRRGHAALVAVAIAVTLAVSAFEVKPLAAATTEPQAEAQAAKQEAEAKERQAEAKAQAEAREQKRAAEKLEREAEKRALAQEREASRLAERTAIKDRQQHRLEEKLRELEVETPEMIARLKALERAAKAMEKEASHEALAHLQRDLAELDTKLGEGPHVAVNAEHLKLAEAQAKLAAEHAALAARQAKLAAEQAVRAEALEREIRTLLEKAAVEKAADKAKQDKAKP